MGVWRLIKKGSLAPQEDPEGNPDMELIHFAVLFQGGDCMAYPIRLFKTMRRWVPRERLRDFKYGHSKRINPRTHEPEGDEWFDGKMRGRR